MSLAVGYCTNVHAGATLAATRENLIRYALEVKRQVSPAEPMGVGLWLAAPAVRDLLLGDELPRFAAWLSKAGLVPYTFNGFPYGDFHEPVVKHRVYEPTWWDDARLEYTLQLIQVQHGLLPERCAGSISTLPIAWPVPHPRPDQLTQAAANLAQVATALARLRAETGREISLCLEPEPGCYLQRSDDLIRFFQDWLWPGRNELELRTHVRVCHDVCHAEVMFEPQAEALRKYAAAGIEIGKVQVSSAVAARFHTLSESDRRAALTQLASFHEPRYLHQTCIRASETAEPSFFEDLPQALATVGAGELPEGEWRTHFHVPIYLERFGYLETSRGAIQSCLETLPHTSRCTHFEVETYAWGVLPEALRVPQLADGIARELNWFRGALTT